MAQRLCLARAPAAAVQPCSLLSTSNPPDCSRRSSLYLIALSTSILSLRFSPSLHKVQSHQEAQHIPRGPGVSGSQAGCAAEALPAPGGLCLQAKGLSSREERRRGEKGGAGGERGIINAVYLLCAQQHQKSGCYRLLFYSLHYAQSLTFTTNKQAHLREKRESRANHPRILKILKLKKKQEAL